MIHPLTSLSEPDPALLQRAIALHGRGDLVGAEGAYRLALAADPRDFHALHLMSLLLSQTGRMQGALALADEALAIEPNLPDALFLRAVASMDLDRPGEAVESCDRALALRPGHADSWNLRGSALKALNRLGEALASYERALAIRPGYDNAIFNRGVVLVELRRHEEALEAFDLTLTLKPSHPGALVMRSVALSEFGRFDEALRWIERLPAGDAGRGYALLHRGNALFRRHRLQEALAAFDAALAIAPGTKDAWMNRGVVLGRLRRFEEAMDSFARALEIAPDCAETLFRRSAVACLHGALESGWRDYEARWRTQRDELWEAERRKKRYLESRLPTWRGEPLAGRKILIYDEQGAGDAIQFCRLVKPLAARGAETTLIVRASLARLLQGLPAKVLTGVDEAEIKSQHCQCALMSLPLALGVTLASIPAETAYLRADPERVRHWRERLGGEGFKIGVVWSASDRGRLQGRSVALAEFAGLSRIPGARLVSLQKNDGVDELDGLPEGMRVETLGADYEAGDFLETASVMGALDLVVSVDTSALHLAAALGRPTFAALPCLADWRWLLDRSDSPWYPTMRLFRAEIPDDWAGVFARIEAAARGLVEAAGRQARAAPADVVSGPSDINALDVKN